MKKHNRLSLSLAFLFLSLGAHFSQGSSMKPSSEIPAKREFPLDESVNPCDQFYDYVCNKVKASFKLREDRSSHTFSMSDSSERLLEAKKSFFVNINKEKNLSPRGQALKTNYIACMDESSGKKEERSYLKQLKKEIYGAKNISDLITWLNGNISKGRPTNLIFGDVENISDPLKKDIYISTSFMGLPDHSYYENVDLLKDYQVNMVEFFRIHGEGENYKIDSQKSEKIVLDILNLEKEFIKTYPKPAERRQRFREKREIEQSKFKEKYPNLKAEQLFSLMPESMVVRLPIPEAVEFYNGFLKEENLLLFKNFLFYRFGAGIMDDAYPKYFKKMFEFNRKYFGGPEKRSARQERCTKSAMSRFNLELDEILIDRLFPKFPEQKMIDLAEKVRNSLLNGLEKNSWLTAESKKEAINKMKLARLQLIKPRNDREWDFLPAAKYDPKKRIANAEILGELAFKKMMNEILDPVNQDKWEMGPLTVNAYYDPSSNKFVLPIGILQYPSFDPNGDMIENLAAIGSIIGHELGHGIDDIGSSFDEKGRLRQWMKPEDLAQFSSRSKKLVDQFNAIGHDGKLTLGENVADLVGLTFAYQAAFADSSKEKNDSVIGLKKRFFISYARQWCGVMRPKFEEKLIKTDPHSMVWARVNEQVKHQPGFAEAFSCPKSSKLFLDDKDRVVIW